MRICRPIRPIPSVVHGDFKLDNVMLDPDDVGRIVAVFDWEMSALGDPLVDLGIVLAYWSPTAPPSQRDALTTVIDRPGYFTQATRSSSATRRGPAATCPTSAITKFSRCSRSRS